MKMVLLAIIVSCIVSSSVATGVWTTRAVPQFYIHQSLQNTTESPSNPTGSPVCVCVLGGTQVGFYLDGSALSTRAYDMIIYASQNGKSISIYYDNAFNNAQYGVKAYIENGQKPLYPKLLGIQN